MDALWESILELTSQFVIPDWGELISLLPLGLAGLVLLWFAWTIRRFATVGPARRAPARVTPVPPPELHMPGPSYAPFAAALGAAALFWGLVVGGLALVIGGTILALTLLYWGREAIRDYDHATHGTAALPAVVHAGPPPGVHMPGPSFRPILGAIGTAALMAGLVFGGWVLAAGVVILVMTLVGWLVDARAEYVKTEEADRTGHLENIPAPTWPRRLLQASAVIFVLAILVQTGVIPPRSDDPEGGGPIASPGATALPGQSEVPRPTDPPGTLVLVASQISFDKLELTVPTGEPFTIRFENRDPPGVVHDVDLRDGGAVIADQPVVNGGESVTYSYEPLDAGTYTFICSIHPIPQMTGTLTVE